MENKEMSEEDYLKRHLGDMGSSKNNNSKESSHNLVADNNINQSNRTSDLQYLAFDVRDFPCGKFYPQGTMFMIRASQVIEIQSYSMVDDNNLYDVIEKMNDMLLSCVRVKYSDGRMSSYLDIKDQDRIYLIFLIRELTFQNGNSLSVNVKCSCGIDNAIELKRQNFRFYEIDEVLNKYFSPTTNSFKFELSNGDIYEISPPNIGLQKAFTEYIIIENNKKVSPNLAFLKIAPFLLTGRSSITYEGIKSKLIEFQNMQDISFQFLNDAISKMTFGIEKIAKVCDCGLEVTADMEFPNGASAIFVVQNAFEAYIKK